MYDENDDGLASPGEVLNYFIKIRNIGDAAATNVDVQDSLSHLLPYIYAPSGNVTINNGGAISTIPLTTLMAGTVISTIEADVLVTLSFTVTVRNDLNVGTVSVLRNVVIVNEEEEEEEIETGAPGLVTTKTVEDADGDGLASPGETITYTITVRNSGDAEALDVVVRDTLEELLAHIRDPRANPVTVTGVVIERIVFEEVTLEV